MSVKLEEKKNKVVKIKMNFTLRGFYLNKKKRDHLRRICISLANFHQENVIGPAWIK